MFDVLLTAMTKMKADGPLQTKRSRRCRGGGTVYSQTLSPAWFRVFGVTNHHYFLWGGGVHCFWGGDRSHQSPLFYWVQWGSLFLGRGLVFLFLFWGGGGFIVLTRVVDCCHRFGRGCFHGDFTERRKMH